MANFIPEFIGFSDKRFDKGTKWLLPLAVILIAAQPGQAAIVDGVTNLIVNGNAEAGAPGTPSSSAASIPGWTRVGNANVLPYALAGYLLLTDPAPTDHGFQYFKGPASGGGSTLTQNIDVSSVAAVISGGNVKFTASAHLGSWTANGGGETTMTVAFKNAAGQTFSSPAPVGPASYRDAGLSLQQEIGLVPSGTVLITVTLTMTNTYAAADSLSLVLAQLGTTPGSVLSANLIVNGNAEAGPSAPYNVATALYIPGWSTANDVSVAPYAATGWISPTDSGPADRGVNLFCGGDSGATSYQDLDVSPAAALIDAGKVTYQVSAWLGGIANTSGPVLTYVFFDWAGNQLAPTAQLGPVSHSGAGLVQASASAILPSGTRRVHVALSFAAVYDAADDVSFILTTPNGPPAITPGGIISASGFGGFTSVAPGSWVEIYGTGLATAPDGWTAAEFTNGVAPTSLDGIQVSIGGQAAFVDYVSPGQIDALLPSNAPLGAQALTITNSNGTSNQVSVNVNAVEPGLLAPNTFMVGGKQYVAALFPDGQTFVLPVGAIPGVTSRPAKPGDTIVIYGVGFGPVTGGFTAGTLVTAQNSLTSPVQFFFGNSPATVAYDGLAPALTGLYQFNLVVPSVAANATEPLSFTLGGAQGAQTLYIAVQN